MHATQIHQETKLQNRVYELVDSLTGGCKKKVIRATQKMRDYGQIHGCHFCSCVQTCSSYIPEWRAGRYP